MTLLSKLQGTAWSVVTELTHKQVDRSPAQCHRLLQTLGNLMGANNQGNTLSKPHNKAIRTKKNGITGWAFISQTLSHISEPLSLIVFNAAASILAPAQGLDHHEEGHHVGTHFNYRCLKQQSDLFMIMTSSRIRMLINWRRRTHH